MLARRFSPVALSLTLSLAGALVAHVGTAEASATRNQKPNGQFEKSKESPIKSAWRAMQKGVKNRSVGAALWEYSERREVSGPSWLQRRFNAIGNGMRNIGKAIGSIGAKGRERRAAARDFKAWTKEEGNEDARTYYRGARAQAGIGWMKAGNTFNAIGGTAVGVMGVMTGNPFAAGVGAGTAALSLTTMKQEIRKEERKVRDRVLSKQFSTVSPVRLWQWQKAGIISPAAAETAVQLGITEQ
jgi:hypothetical protein